MTLPQDQVDQVYVSVQAIQAGSAFLPDKLLYRDCENNPDIPDTAGSRVPVLAFLVTHPTKGKAMFDLGVRKNDGEGHPPGVQPAIKFLQTRCEKDVTEILQSGGVDPAEINTIIYSHLHWDHVGDPEPFTSAEIVLGAEARSLLENAYPTNPSSSYMALPPGRRTRYLDFAEDEARLPLSFGPFERAIDLYGDGSFYVLGTPGHLRGHISAAARIGPNTFILLAGDACHGRQCYCPGIREMSTGMHEMWETAQETAGKLSRLDKEYAGVLVILAHEKERLEEGMPQFPAELNGWASVMVEKRRAAAGQNGVLASSL